jgi:hypothetical protein
VTLPTTANGELDRVVPEQYIHKRLMAGRGLASLQHFDSFFAVSQN